MFRKKQIVASLLILLSLVESTKSYAGVPPTIIWQKCFGWTDGRGDEAIKIIPTSDGNQAIIGKKALQGIESFWIGKTNYQGNLLWEVSVLDDDNYAGFRPADIIQAPDGSFIITGRVINMDKLVISGYQKRTLVPISVNRGYFDILILKLDANGQFVWQKTIGGSGNDTPVKILPTIDNGYMMVGYSNSTDGDLTETGKNISGYNFDYFLVKVDFSGNIQFKKSIGGNNDDVPNDAIRMEDGGFVIVGHSNSDDETISANKGGKDGLAIKVDASGNLQWKKTYGGSQNDEIRAVSRLSNGEILLGFTSNSLNQDFQFTANDNFPNNFNENIWLFKTSILGEVQQKQIFGGSRKDALASITRSNDGSFYLSACSNSTNGNITDRNRIPNNNLDARDAVIMKINESLEVQWVKSLGGSADDEAISLIETSDGGIMSLGVTQSFDGDVEGNHWSGQDNRDIWLVKLNQPCDYTVYTSKDLVATNADIIADDAVVSSDRIKQNSSIRYGANKNVDLLDGFDSESGSTVEVSLWGCTNSQVSMSENPIQFKIKNECREGGMKFTFHPFTPNTDISYYKISVQNLDPRVPFTYSNNTLITHNIGEHKDKNAYYLVTVSRDGYKDASFQGYTSTCDHDGNPLDCPENDHDLILDKEYYKEGDSFTATWTGGLGENTGMQWFPTNITITSQTNDRVTGIINSFPADIQAQPSFPNFPKPCHGAVKVVFSKAK